MTDQDRGIQPTEGSSEAPVGGRPPVEPEQAEANQTLADSDQSLGDADQTGSDSDQSAADGDQVASDGDQAAADDDQAASDRDLAAGGDAGLHDSSRDVRRRSADERRFGSRRRSETAGTRDAVAQARDLAAAARDQAAAKFDQDLDERDARWAADRLLGSSSGAVARARDNRERAAGDRGASADARVRAAADRQEAAKDRAAAAEDRIEAQADRDALMHELAISETDGLTGARTRVPGLADLDHEIDRARRSTGILSLAYVDVVGLKVVNDTSGHAAGDALLRAAVRAIRNHLRSYDPVVRVGGDEFFCVLSGVGVDTARQRFGAIQMALAEDPTRGQIKVALAALAPGDTGADLVERADAASPSSPAGPFDRTAGQRQ